MLGLIKVSSEQLGQTVVMITHNEEIARWRAGLSAWRMEGFAEAEKSVQMIKSAEVMPYDKGEQPKCHHISG